MKPGTARLTTLAGLFAIVSMSAGCLVKQTSTSVCLEPDGSARWSVLDRDIHATAETPADRQREEDEFLAAAMAGEHPAAATFRALGASDVRSELVSARWPFAVLTEARFADVSRVCQRILDTFDEIRAQSVLERQGARTTWRITVDYVPDTSRADTSAALTDNQLLPLVGEDAPVFFIRHGQFVEAVGFDVADDGRVAKMKDLDGHDWEKEPHLGWSLTWVANEAGGAAPK